MISSILKFDIKTEYPLKLNQPFEEEKEGTISMEMLRDKEIEAKDGTQPQSEGICLEDGLSTQQKDAKEETTQDSPRDRMKREDTTKMEEEMDEEETYKMSREHSESKKVPRFLNRQGYKTLNSCNFS